ncbi:Crp/Fnr family transcriptional regulator [Sphingomonas lenta]|uniref:Cyclic nucleotide-binding protein n=1 Tax=Sphingomonas lenta TaxID=1141887 RepID=A0A2A2SG43_9SPHN|nr:Crp/Fnr family transcriptional regulator [Sphingomonas lenta]PAX07981.1 cyclic nucleotide-binding protein [Sphingomonas lenta]
MLTRVDQRTDRLILKLQAYTRFSEEDRAALAALGRAPVQEASPRHDLIREGDEPRTVRLILSGWACRYKTLPDGRRQIVGFFVPGDFCDLNVYILKEMDHSVGAITRVGYIQIAPDEMERVMEARPRIARALLWHELVTSAVQREWLLNVGQRTARERIAHLLVEMFVRLRVVGLTQGDACDFPITQNDIGEATGLTPVHVNRTLQELRGDGLIELAQRRLTIPDLKALMRASMFNPNYLHLDHEGRHLDAND